MAKASMILEDYVATLKKTQFPTVVTEGKDDYAYFRRMEVSLAGFGVSFLPVGGRSMVLKLFEKRKEFGRNDIIFVIDQDIWVFSGVPTDFQHRKVILSDGYSIENDCYRDGELEKLLHADEVPIFQKELESVCDCHSYSISQMLSGNEGVIADHPNWMLTETGNLNEDYLKSIGYSSRDERLYFALQADYSRVFRGKTLLELLVRRLSKANRSVKFGYKQLMEIAAMRNGVHYQRVSSEINAFFEAERVR